MYLPKFTITGEILRNVGAIEAAKEVIENAPLVPAFEAKFRDDAALRSAHYGTALEGNDLTLAQAKLILDEEMTQVDQAETLGLVARERDVQEVINYRQVMEYLDKVQGAVVNYAQEELLELHKLVVNRLVAEGLAGRFRKTQVVLKNSVTGEVGLRPPNWAEVPYLMQDFFDWLNSTAGKKEHPVIRAAIAHYVLAAVHPFVEGNGRTARAFATMILFTEGYDIKRFFALEEYFDQHADEYYGSLMEVSNQSPLLKDRDLTPWLAVFTRALAVELSRIKEKVRALSVDMKMKQNTGQQIALTERQMKIVEYIQANNEISMSEARKILSMVSEDTILRDLRYLLEKKVLLKRGSTKAAKYWLKK
jgi:Fic family protein